MHVDGHDQHVLVVGYLGRQRNRQWNGRDQRRREHWRCAHRHVDSREPDGDGHSGGGALLLLGYSDKRVHRGGRRHGYSDFSVDLFRLYVDVHRQRELADDPQWRKWHGRRKRYLFGPTEYRSRTHRYPDRRRTDGHDLAKHGVRLRDCTREPDIRGLWRDGRT